MKLGFWNGLGTSMKMGTLAGGGAASLPTYAYNLVNTHGIDEVYPLTDIAGGTNIEAYVSAAHDGTLTLGSGSLQNAAGPVSGGLAPYFDGATGLWDIGSIGLIWNHAIGNVLICGKVSAVGDWSDGVTRSLLSVSVSGGANAINIFKHGTLGIRVYLTIGSVLKIVTVGTMSNTTDWFQILCTWKDGDNGDEMKVYVNGTQSGTTQSGFGSGGAPGTFRVGQTALNTEVWKGWIAYPSFKFGSLVASPANIYSALATSGPDTNP